MSTTTTPAAGMVGAVSTFRTRPVSGRRYVVVVCDDCNAVINSGHQYTPDQLADADRAAHQHNVDMHPALLGQQMGARRFLADVSSGRPSRFRCPTDLADHVEAISGRLYGTAQRHAKVRAHFSWGYLKECDRLLQLH